MENNSKNCDKVVLFAKQPGKTSFSSLFTIKHAFDTQKVGHTGTLDSFAQGLLVVCCGSLTRLAGRITEFDKEYEAVIKFGEETDTLECTGKVVRMAELPDEESFLKAVNLFTGDIMQVPPVFSAIHVDGKRSSDLMRSGKAPEIPPRPVKVYSSEVLELNKDERGLIKYARIRFSVSKGTYIRSLARDIGKTCGSAAHLTGLLRTRIGMFKLENAAGYNLLEKYTIENAVKMAQKVVQLEKEENERKAQLMAQGLSKKQKNMQKAEKIISQEELDLQQEVRNLAVDMSQELASQCGFASLELCEGSEAWFENGGKLSSSMFTVSPFTLCQEFAAVFTNSGQFAGLLQKDSNGYFKYAFVVKYSNIDLNGVRK